MSRGLAPGPEHSEHFTKKEHSVRLSAERDGILCQLKPDSLLPQFIMMEKQLEEANCSVTRTVSIIGGKWKPPILSRLVEGSKRFGELQRLVPNITKKMLTEQLKELEQDKIIERKVYRQVPPKVEYSLSGYGESLKPVLKAMEAWGSEHHIRHGKDKETTLPAE